MAAGRIQLSDVMLQAQEIMRSPAVENLRAEGLGLSCFCGGLKVHIISALPGIYSWMPFAHQGGRVIAVPAGQPFPMPAVKGDGFKSSTREPANPKLQGKPRPFYRPSRMSGLLREQPEMCDPARQDDPGDPKLLTGFLSACLVSKHKPLWGNLPLPLGQAEEQCLCCNSLNFPFIGHPVTGHAQKHPFLFLK